jgi:N-acetylneuraminic acid mutarotase
MAAIALVLSSCKPSAEHFPEDAPILGQRSQPAGTPGWSMLASLASARSGHTVTLLSPAQVLVVGGEGLSGSLATTELWDLATGAWASAGTLSEARRDHTATRLPSGKVLVVGGAGTGSILDSTELYDPATGAWVSTGSLAQARKNHTATLLPSGKVLVTGGEGLSGALATAELYDPATGSWTPTGSLSEGRGFSTATLLPSGRVLIAGGEGPNGMLATAELYDPATGSWASTGSLSQARKNHTATQLPSGKLLVTGGVGPGGALATAELYDPATGAWASTNSLAQARSAATATLLPSGRVLVTGGEAPGGALATAELYDPTTGSWASALALSQARALHVATLLPSGRVLVVGGLAAGNPLASAELYEPAAGSWMPTPWLPFDRYGHTATLLPSGKVLVVGGHTSESQRSAQVYDPATGSWTATGSLSSGRVHHTATLLLSGKVLVVGGEGSGGYLTAAELYDPATGTWSATGSPGMERFAHTATLLPSGKVLITGGWGNTGPLATSELYDPVTGSWTATGALAQARYVHAATLLPSGRVLVTGGHGPSSPLVSAELYEPTTGTWTATGSLAQDRAQHTATLLLSGKVLVAGGWGDTGYLASSELYDPATSSWTATGSLGTDRFAHTATLLPSGQVLVVSADGGTSPTGELYDPATGSWRYTAWPARAGHYHTATLLPSGKVLVTGGSLSGINSELYDDTGASPAWQPTITSVSGLTALEPGSAFTVSGSLLRGLSEASDGSSRSSPTDFPLVTLLDPERGRLAALPSRDFSSTHVTASVPALPPGQYLLSVTVNGLTSSTLVAIGDDVTAPDITPPSAVLTAPTAGAWQKGTVTLSATASDNFGVVTRVEFYDGDTLLGTDSSAPYSLTWDTELAAPGPHLLTVRAYDTSEQVGTSSGVRVWVDNLAPTVAFTAPAAGSTVTGTVTVSAVASDDFAVTRVEFYDGDTLLGADTSSPYGWSWNTRLGLNGDHTLTAKAYDAAGHTTIATRTVTANNDLSEPTVTLTAPGEGQTLKGTVVFTATASDDRAVTRVAFFIGTTQVGADTTAPYSFSYNTRLQGNGARVITAKAYDAANNVGTSASVNVMFDNDFTPPAVTLTSPAEGETLTGTVVFTATASDTSGISKVVFFVGTAQVGTDTTAPYSFSYNTRLMTNGSRVITAKATDGANNVGTSAPVSVTFNNDLTAPTTSITSPAGGSTLSGVVQINATASDDRGTVTKVDFYRGTTLLGTVTAAPYTWSWDTTTVPIGNHTLKTRAWDAAGNSAYSANVTVTVTRQATALGTAPGRLP